MASKYLKPPFTEVNTIRSSYNSNKRVESLKLISQYDYDKRNYFNFPIVNFPFIGSNIPAAPAYGVYISQLIRYYCRACDCCYKWSY
jgi:hypothetical protein